MVNNALEAAKLLKNGKIEASVLDMHTIKPIDVDIIEEISKSHDLIVIDGQDNYHFEQQLSARTLCFRHAQDFISPDGIILVDDSWRYPEIREISRCKKMVVHESTGPCRKGVTSTDLHYY